jgi:D-cysteine desulfhydrase
LDAATSLTDPVNQGLIQFARHTGIVLDPVCTGRAFANLVAVVREGSVRRGQRTVFLLSGGLSGFFGNPAVLAFAGNGA